MAASTRRRRSRPRSSAPGRTKFGTVVLKLGGELLEPAHLSAVARLVARVSKQVKLVVVHGGGREIDAALAQASIPTQQVDGLRITDEATLQIVVAVLGGSINTRFVAAVNAAGGRAVGLTGADSTVGPVKPAKPHRASNGEMVDLGLVGEPIESDPALVESLCDAGFVPVIACIGAARDGRLFNVNADTLAASLASRLRASRLIVAGATPGVLNGGGKTIAALDSNAVETLVRSGTASAGMVAKLKACRHALEHAVADVVIADGRDPSRLMALLKGSASRRGAWTRLVNHVSD